jgi:hypothetical protein
METFQSVIFKIYNFFKKQPLRLLFIIIPLILALVLPPLISELTRRGRNIHLENRASLKISDKEIKNLQLHLANLLGDQDLDVVIRTDSISYATSDQQTTANFLIDIDSLKQTYAITIYDTDIALESPSVEVKCPKISDSKYPDSECQTPSNTSHDLNLHLPYETKLSSGEKVYVKDITIEPNGKNIQIYLYSCEDENPKTEETKNLIRNWVENTVKDPLAKYYVYRIRTGYCKDDPIF